MLANIEDYQLHYYKKPKKFYFQNGGYIEMYATKKDLEHLEEKMDLKFEQVDYRFEQIDARFEQIDARFEQIDARFEQVDARFEQIDARFDRLEKSIDRRFEQVDKRFEEIGNQFKVIDMKFEIFEERETKRMIVLLVAIFMGVILNNWNACLDWILRFF